VLHTLLIFAPTRQISGVVSASWSFPLCVAHTEEPVLSFSGPCAASTPMHAPPRVITQTFMRFWPSSHGSCYNHFLAPISPLLGTQIDSYALYWVYPTGFRGWCIWPIGYKAYFSQTCMGLIQDVYSRSDHIFGYPLGPSLHIHCQI
jgi:hypothetical protein